MRVLVTGAAGQLGSELCRQFGNDAKGVDVTGVDTVGTDTVGTVAVGTDTVGTEANVADATGLDITRLDITDRDAVRRLLAELRPDVVINAAAFTAVDAAETEIETCRRVNADAVAHLAAACRETGGALMQISTDYVFAARGRSVPWQETDPPLPLCRYAADKLLGEQHARTVPKHFVVRTCGLYGLLADGRPGRNFVESMLRLAKRGDPIRVVDDQRCSPTYVPHLAASATIPARERRLRALPRDGLGEHDVARLRGRSISPS